MPVNYSCCLLPAWLFFLNKPDQNEKNRYKEQSGEFLEPFHFLSMFMTDYESRAPLTHTAGYEKLELSQVTDAVGSLLD
jgi:hypothetical protein